MHNFSVDDIVSCQGEEFMVTKVNPANLKARNLKTGKPWNIPKYASTFVRKPKSEDFIQKLEAISQSFVLGAPVQFKNNPKVGDTTFVVIGVSSNGFYRVARLGGDNDRYYKNIPASSLKGAQHILFGK